MPELSALDRTDFEILTHLWREGRLSNKEVALRVGLAPSTTHGRVQRLEASGVLEGCRAEVDLAQVGLGVRAMISVRLGRHERKTVERFLDAVSALREVIEVFHLAGSQDILVHVAVHDVEALREFVLNELARREVAHVETNVVFQHRRSPSAPFAQG